MYSVKYYEDNKDGNKDDILMNLHIYDKIILYKQICTKNNEIFDKLMSIRNKIKLFENNKLHEHFMEESKKEYITVLTISQNIISNNLILSHKLLNYISKEIYNVDSL
jgi:hypothetical protein